MPPKVADCYTEARLSLPLLQFPPGDCSVRSVSVLFAFLFLPPTHRSPSLSSRVLLSRMAEAELHKERLQAIAVSQFPFTCSFVLSRGLLEGRGDSGTVAGKHKESLACAKLCVEFPVREMSG